MSKKPKWRNIGILALALGLLAYLIFAIIKSSNREETLQCKKIEVSIVDGNEIQFITEKDIINILDKKKQKLIGKRQQNINTDKLEKILQEDPVIHRAECFKLPSGNIKIKIWQRHPILRVYGTHNYYVDAEGKTFPTSQHYTAFVPIVTGNAKKTFITSKLKDFVLYIQKDPFWEGQVQQIDVSNYRICIIPRLGDHEIILGTLDEYEQKLHKLKVFYKNGLSKIGWGDYESINAEFKEQIVCTKKQP